MYCTLLSSPPFLSYFFSNEGGGGTAGREDKKSLSKEFAALVIPISPKGLERVAMLLMLALLMNWNGVSLNVF